jgi:hypothetical protein
MNDYKWLEAYPDVKLKELHGMAASQVAFRNISVWQRCIVAVALTVPFLASLIVIIQVMLRASQFEQFMVLVGCGIGVALWALSREARRRRVFLQAVQAELERRN